MLSWIKKLRNNDFYQGGFFLTISSFVVNLLNYFFYLIIGRTLGPVGYGEIMALFSYINLFSVPISVISLIIIQKISSTQYPQLDYALTLENFFWSKVRKWWFLLLLLFLLIPFLPRITNLSPETSFILVPIAVLTLISAFYGPALQGLRLFNYIFFISIFTTAVKFTGALTTLTQYKSLIVVLLFVLLSTFTSLYLSILLIHKSAIKKVSITKGVIQKRLINIATSSHFLLTTLSTLGITALNNVDIIFVKKFFDPVDSGLYSSWSLFAKIILYFIGPLISLSYIFFASKKSKNEQNHILFISLAILLVIGLINFVVYQFFGNQVVSLFFGNKFEKIIPILGPAALFGVLYTAITILNNYFLAMKSKFALILPLCIPLYTLLLLVSQRQLMNVINVNISVSTLIFVLYLIAWSKNNYQRIQKNYE